MSAIKENKASNQRYNIVQRINGGVARVKNGDIKVDLPLYIELAIGSLSAAGCYKFYTLCLEKRWGSVVLMLTTFNNSKCHRAFGQSLAVPQHHRK